MATKLKGRFKVSVLLGSPLMCPRVAEKSGFGEGGKIGSQGLNGQKASLWLPN